MALQPASGFGPRPQANGEPQSQNRVLSTHFSPQPNGASWSMETGAQSLHYAYHPRTASSAPAPGMAALALSSSHAVPPHSPSLSVLLAEIEASAAAQNQAAAANVAVPTPQHTDAHQPFAPPIPGRHASASRRSKYASLDWDAHRETIWQLYMDEDKPLKETMEIMAEQYSLRASEKLYKEKFKEWGWCKNLSAANAQWMLSKANARLVEEQKETIFVIGGRVWTLESVEKRVRRAGKQGRSEVQADAPTPMGVTYSTPREVADHPSPAIISSPTNQRDFVSRWAPAPDSSIPANRYTMRLTWNGCTTTEAMKRFREAQKSDQQGDAEGAERQFRDALAAFEHLLSPTHEDTKTAAYSLAAFYARRGRMQEANNVLDWMSEKHIERWGLRSKPTVDHVLRVVDLLNNWLRPQDALAFLEKAKDYLWQSDPRACGQEGQHSSSLPYNGDTTHQISGPASSAFRTVPFLENSSSEIAINPSSIVDNQLRSAGAHVKANDESIEPVLLSLIAQCEQNPDKLAAQNLRARAELIELYRESGRTDAAIEELSKAQASFLATWRRDSKITKELIDAFLEVAAQSLKLEQYNDADEMFQIMQDWVVETLGPDHSRTIWILIRIGLMYQDENRWNDAEPRFEQALAASMTANGLGDGLTRSLEAALDSQHYSFINSEPEDFVTIVGNHGVRISPI